MTARTPLAPSTTARKASMRTDTTRPNRVLGTGLAALLAAASCTLATAGVAHADTAPLNPGVPATVSADALPTVQVDGVVWSQAVVGNTVYVGGKFTTARPAGSAAGVNTTPRNNLLAYDIRTGALITSFAPNLNGQVLGVTASPDGSRLYVAGEFTVADGAARYRIAAYDTATGKLVTSFAPTLDFRARTVVATGNTVYVGGAFNSANGQKRPRLAAFAASNGALLSWAPTADAQVSAMVMAPDQSKLIVGGQFASLSGTQALGLGAIDPVSGATVPWAANQTVQDSGTSASITSLSADGNQVYGTGYVFGPGGNLEGTFAADAASGKINWVEDCHGDTYSAFAAAGVVYTASHAHYCGNVGGFGETNPRTHHHALAFTTAATGTLTNDTQGYFNWGGTAAPSMLDWFPDLTTGAVTGQNQAAWNVTGNGQYVVMGGEFPSVNGTGQQGLVRFAVRSTAPNLQGPLLKGASFVPSVPSFEAGAVRVSWPANWDRDNEQLVYKVLRDGGTTPVFTTTANSTFWNRPLLGFVDRGLVPGSVHRYRVTATDPLGNTAIGDWVSTTVSAGTPAGAYAGDVVADGASSYWRLGEPSGTASYDHAGFQDLTLDASVVRGEAGAIAGDTDGASRFAGTTGATPTRIAGPNTFSVEAWFKTDTTTGGKLFGFGDSQTGNSNHYDRHVYMDNDGHLVFGAFDGGTRTARSAAAYNDNSWHHVVATMGPDGMALYVDAKRVGRTATTAGEPFAGFWRIGGDNLGGWPYQPASNTFTGVLDDVAVYPTALTVAQVQKHFTDSGRTVTTGVRPADAYGAAVYDAGPDSYWRLDETAGTTAADATTNGAAGQYAGGATPGAAGVLPGTGSAVTLDGVDGVVNGTAYVDNPTAYTEELWFKTTTTRGGKLIGFGSSQSGRSGSYDRHVYMLDDGRLRFGTWTGQVNLADTTASYNDGQWHHLVATQGADGMKLYVDATLAASNGQTAAQAYGGYFRLGGDTTWGGASSDYFQGTLDEAAVYSRPLTAAEVVAHYRAGGGKLPNALPTASFTSTAANLTASFDASASTDPDGTVAAYAWDFGDGATGTGRTATHAFAAAGSYPVTLTVTDDAGGTATTSQTVTVTRPANVAPTAGFTATATGLSVAVDGSTSSDPDGTVAAYSWNYGDGTPAGTGATATHTYAAAGTYVVTLQVTDDQGATAVTARSVTVVVPPYAADSFTRTAAGGFGTADTGGAWTVTGGTSNFSVSGSTGRIRVPSAGMGPAATLASVSATDVDVRTSVSLDAAATGGGTYVSLLGRKVGTSDYRLKVRYQATGAVVVTLGRVVSGTETTLASTTLAGVVAKPGDVLQLRLQVTGTGTTALAGKVWVQGTAEPAAWLLSATDTTAALQTAGSVGVLAYLSSTSTAAVTASFDDLLAVRP